MRANSGDTEIYYEIMGDGPAVVLLHPFPATHDLWMPVAEMLANRYRVVLPDLRGHGNSSPGTGPATMEKHAADVLRVCDDAGIGRAFFAGISIGGYILFEIWRRSRERVAALALCCTRAQADSPEARAARLAAAEDVRKRGPGPFIDSMLPKLLGESTRRDRPDLVERAASMMRRNTAAGIAVVQEGMAARPDSVPTLQTIRVPVAILAGAEDVLIPADDAELMHKTIAGSELHVIPRAGHYAVFEQPEPAGKLLRRFFDSHR